MNQAPDITQPLFEILRAHSQGISEHELIAVLKQPEVGIFNADLRLSDPLCLFQTHFYLFNQLYQLRNALRRQQRAELVIGATSIRLMPFDPGQTAVGEADALGAYYLDWQNFDNTGKEDVNALLDDFWQRMSGRVSNEQRRDALAILDLPEDASQQQIRRQYRILMHQHHPDKGGDVARTRQLTAAYQKLT